MGWHKQCTRNKQNRTITREQNEGLISHGRAKQNPRIMKLRKALVEHPFGTIKRGMGMSYFLWKGMEAVRAEMSLTVLAYNLKRVLNLLNFAEHASRCGKSVKVGAAFLGFGLARGERADDRLKEALCFTRFRLDLDTQAPCTHFVFK